MKKIKLFVATPHERSEDIVFGGEEEEERELGDSEEPCAGSAKLPHVPTGTIPARLELDTSCASFMMHTRSVVRYPRRTMTVMWLVRANQPDVATGSTYFVRCRALDMEASINSREPSQ